MATNSEIMGDKIINTVECLINNCGVFSIHNWPNKTVYFKGGNFTIYTSCERYENTGFKRILYGKQREYIKTKCINFTVRDCGEAFFANSSDTEVVKYWEEKFDRLLKEYTIKEEEKRNQILENLCK